MNNSLVLPLVTIIAILIIFLLVIVIYRSKGQRMEPDYRVFFILGITWLPIGIATENPGLWGLGIVFMALGLANRSKWKEQPKWSELDPQKRKIKILIILGVTVLLFVGLAFYILGKSY